MYLVTCPHGNSVGLFPLALPYVAEDLQWSAREVDRAFAALEAEGLAYFDPDAGVVYVPAILTWDPISTEAQARGAVRRLSALPQTPLIERLGRDLLPRVHVMNPNSLRPLLEYLGMEETLTAVSPPSDPHPTPRQTGTQSQSHSHSPSQSQSRRDDGEEITAGEPRIVTSHTRNIDAINGTDVPAPRTPAEELVDDLILPTTREFYRRDEWLKALRSPGALKAVEKAWGILNAAKSHAEIRNPGAFLWAKFRELVDVQDS